MRKPKSILLGLTILALTLGLSVMPLTVQARDVVRSVSPAQLCRLYTATHVYGFTSPVISETTRGVGARLGAVSGEEKYTSAVAGTSAGASSPVLFDILGQDYAAHFIDKNPSRANEPMVPAETARLAHGLGAGDNSIPSAPTAQAPGPTGPGALESDRAALVALYDATDGENWATSTNWLSSEPLGDWYGVATNDAGRVTEIRLPQNRLAGELPLRINDLTELTHLDLRRNELIGEIPDDLDDLINLDSLSLANNLLSGDIPTELGNLPDLESLSLENNQLDGDIPTELGNLSALEHLHLGNNQLSGSIPPEMGNLINLRWLSLGGNQLSGEIPGDLGNLADLRYLNLSHNRLNGQIPAGLRGLTRLTHLDLSRNRLDAEIPAAIGGLTGLEFLSLRGNRIIGQIPPELGSLTSLIDLDLSNNQLVGQIPPELGSLSGLTGMYLSGNRFAGCIPVDLWDVAMNDLDELELSDCGLTVVMGIPPGGVHVRIDSPIAVTATFSEPVTGFTGGDVSVVNGLASNFAGSGVGAIYTFDVTPNAIGGVMVAIPAGVVEDAEGDVNIASRLSLGIPYDDDNDEGISKSEAITAIRDYFRGVITKAQAIAVIRLYFRSVG